MNLDEALRIQKFKYSSTRDDYEVNDESPRVLVLDDDYNVDGKGRSILGFNLDYLDNLSKKEKNKLVKKINKLDNNILDLGGVKKWLTNTFNIGKYDGLSKNVKIKRYEKLTSEFPELKKIIRRYKYTGISKK